MPVPSYSEECWTKPEQRMALAIIHLGRERYTGFKNSCGFSWKPALLILLVTLVV